MALGSFTRRKLKRLSTWPLWLAGERKQLEQFNDLRMFGESMLPTKDAMVLRIHWNYMFRRTGKRRCRLYCDGSEREAPALRAMALTYSSCVEHPIQRLFLSLAAKENFLIYGGDAKDAYAHSPASDKLKTFVKVDDAFCEWYKDKYSVDLDQRLVLSVQKALQRHQEAGFLWERRINEILCGPRLNFKPTTHERNIYSGEFRGKKVLFLR